MKRTCLILFAIVCFFVLSAESCGNSTKDPSVQSDNDEASFKKVDGKRPRVPVDKNLYTIKGQVIGDPSSLTRQTEPSGGTITGYNGFISGSSFGPRFAGKGFVRVKVLAMSPRAPFAGTEDVVILKTGDTKAAALIPQDVVEFKCRAQYEAVAPIQTNERFNKDRYGTWEFDFCRLTSPDIGGKQ